MSKSLTTSVDRRGEIASLMGLMLSILCGIFLVLLGMWSEETSASICSYSISPAFRVRFRRSPQRSR